LRSPEEKPFLADRTDRTSPSGNGIRRGIVRYGSQPLSSKRSINSRVEVFLPRMLTSFLFCCLQVCRLSFFPYVITLVFAAVPSMGERIGQEIKKAPTGA
jgi:hypothetical protein